MYVLYVWMDGCMYVCICIHIHMYVYIYIYGIIPQNAGNCCSCCITMVIYIRRRVGRAKNGSVPRRESRDSSSNDACVHRLRFTMFYSPKSSGALFSFTNRHGDCESPPMGQGSEGRSAGRCARPRLDSGSTWRSFHFDVT